MKRWSLRTRLTTAIVALVAAVLIAFVVVLFLAVRDAAWRQHDNGLVARAQALSGTIEHDEAGFEINLPAEPAGVRPTYVEIRTADGAVIGRSASVPPGGLPRVDAGARPVFVELRLPDGRPGRAVAIRFSARNENATTDDHPVTLLLAESTEDVNAAISNVQRWFALLGGLVLVAVAFVTVGLLRHGLRPLTDLATELEKIDDQKLATRVDLQDPPIELAAPIAKLNELLARLDTSFSRERQFTADVSHELRTPLAGLRTLLEVTALIDRSTADYQTSIADALAIVMQLGTLVETLLVLARIDNGQIETEARTVALRELVDACWRPHVDAAAGRSLSFTNAVPVDAIASTDRAKLQIIVGNLLANAAEYTAPGGSIEVTAGPGAVVLDVIDSGPAIPADQLDRIFDRLWRGDAARTSTGLHCGIGLSLARSLCTCLSLTIAADNRPDGSVRFRIARPPASAPTPQPR